MKCAFLWAARLTSVIAMCYFCYQNPAIGSSSYFPFWAIPVLVGLQVFMLYAFSICIEAPAKHLALRQGLAFVIVILFRWAAVLQCFVHGTAWNELVAGVLAETPYILLLHIPVQIAFALLHRWIKSSNKPA